jgi:hypothetical protein
MEVFLFGDGAGRVAYSTAPGLATHWRRTAALHRRLIARRLGILLSCWSFVHQPIVVELIDGRRTTQGGRKYQRLF